ncbi:hypothetical protein LCGC14_0987170 [marine sediment metagenome]|uniref:Uncharacterized protein n=2 Tax=root TaxID=1 RepID=A0A9C9NEV7_9HYPH|nr:hypothetical protein [Aurantimonas coralicida]
MIKNKTYNRLGAALALAFLAFLVGATANAQFDTFHSMTRLLLGDGDCEFSTGTGTPESVVTGDICDLFFRTDGGAGTIFYVKESGAGNTGWAPLASGGGGVHPVIETDGGTGQTTFTQGDLLYSDTANSLAKLAAVAVNQVLASQGVGAAPSYTASPIVTTITATTVRQTGANGQLAELKQATTEVTGMSGATVTATTLIPAGSLVVGVSLRVTTNITGANTFDVGDGVDVDRWGAAVALASSTTTDIADFTILNPVNYAAATDVVLTANGPDFTAGAVRLTVHYLDLTAATS